MCFYLGTLLIGKGNVILSLYFVRNEISWLWMEKAVAIKIDFYLELFTFD